MIFKDMRMDEVPRASFNGEKRSSNRVLGHSDIKKFGSEDEKQPRRQKMRSQGNGGETRRMWDPENQAKKMF